MRICGIDPGLGTSGYAVLDVRGSDVTVCDAGFCRTDSGADLAWRLSQIESDFDALFEQWKPKVVGVEELYAHYKHPRTAILMGHARGVILSTAARYSIDIRGYSATKIKRFLTGNGRATKKQIQRAVTASLNLPEMPEPADVADALAIGLACAFDLSVMPLKD